MRLLDFLKRKPSPKMHIALVSMSKNKDIDFALLSKIAQACEKQLFEDFAPFWQRAGIAVTPYPDPAKLSPDSSPLIIFDESDSPGALGYHTVTPQGLPFGRIFVSPILENGGTLTSGANSLSCTISHEVLEAVGDPYVDLWADCSSTEEDAYELCDRTEGDSYNGLGGVALSNFLGPRAFRDGAGPYDWMGLLASPWEVRPGGYCVRRKGGPSGTTRQIFGNEHPEWKKNLRANNPHSRGFQRQCPKENDYLAPIRGRWLKCPDKGK